MTVRRSKVSGWRAGAKALALLGMCVAGLAPAQGQAAEARHIALDYEIYVGGFHTFSVSYEEDATINCRR